MGYYTSMILLIPAMILSVVASSRVQSAFKSFSQVADIRGLTGAQAARMMLDANGLGDVQINQIQGTLTDNYNPKTKTLNLSTSVCNVNSISAISVACHEAGHALQHAFGYAPLRIRNNIVPIVSFASRVSWILIMVGIMLLASGSYQYGVIGDTIFNIGVLAFVAVVVFHLITLPIELDASNRALNQMEALNIVTGTEEAAGAKKVLSAAALTYIAALVFSVANLLRVLAIRGRR
ncbi:MAG: zinc metallopeptidase [Firmicutes bacterium]|nr:zinc metallopeptidase [Bacillota bacterium]